MVTTTDTSSPSSEWIGVTLMSVRTLRPSGTDSSISSARIVVASSSCRARGNSSREALNKTGVVSWYETTGEL